MAVEQIDISIIHLHHLVVRAEGRVAMALTGVTAISHISEDVLVSDPTQ